MVSSKLKVTRATWSAMIHRCTNPHNRAWKYYGGANPPVTVDAKWRTFEGFLADMGLKPAGTILSRLMDTGPYTKLNCRYHTRAESALEARRKRLKARYGENGYGSNGK
jgi:hypothetical protein